MGKLPDVIRIGQVWEYASAARTNHGRFFMLAQSRSNSVNLISLGDGNRWSDGAPVDDVLDITRDELGAIIGPYSGVGGFSFVAENVFDMKGAVQLTFDWDGNSRSGKGA